jgi:hypothetical protein
MICIDIHNKVVKMPDTDAAYKLLKLLWFNNNANLMRHDFPVVASRHVRQELLQAAGIDEDKNYIAGGGWSLELI